MRVRNYRGGTGNASGGERGERGGEPQGGRCEVGHIHPFLFGDGGHYAHLRRAGRYGGNFGGQQDCR